MHFPSRNLGQLHGQLLGESRKLACQDGADRATLAVAFGMMDPGGSVLPRCLFLLLCPAFLPAKPRRDMAFRRQVQ
jgi:hypothetical protein